MARKILFIRVFASAPIGISVAEMLRTAFPEYTVQTVDITRLLKRRPDILLVNTWYMLLAYGRDLLAGHKKVRGAFLATPYLFHRVKELITEQIAPYQKEYVFTFQLQSLFDTSTDFLPHFVYTDHTHLANQEYPEFQQYQLYSPAWLALERSIYQNARLVFTRSTNIALSVKEQYGVPDSQVVCVYAGVNVKTRPEVESRLSCPERYAQRHVLFVGIDWERKGGPELVRAFRQVQAIYPDARLTIVGATPVVDLPNCQVVGLLPVSEVQPYYEKASLFCLPTKMEPFGVVFVEAMANRLPIIATEVGAIPDLVENGVNGRLIPANDVEQLAESLIDLLGDPAKLQTYGENSYKLAKNRYNWSSVGAAIRGQIDKTLEYG